MLNPGIVFSFLFDSDPSLPSLVPCSTSKGAIPSSEPMRIDCFVLSLATSKGACPLPRVQLLRNRWSITCSLTHGHYQGCLPHFKGCRHIHVGSAGHSRPFIFASAHVVKGVLISPSLVSHTTGSGVIISRQSMRHSPSYSYH